MRRLAKPGYDSIREPEISPGQAKRAGFLGRSRMKAAHGWVLVICLALLLLSAFFQLYWAPQAGSPGRLGLQFQQCGGAMTGAESTNTTTTTSPRPPNYEKLAPQKRYLDALVCKGFSNQITSLADSAALAYLLNATLVLPTMYTGYNFHALGDLQVRWLHYDPQVRTLSLAGISISPTLKLPLTEQSWTALRVALPTVQQLPEQLFQFPLPDSSSPPLALSTRSLLRPVQEHSGRGGLREGGGEHELNGLLEH
mmetsp:Transcript_32342/g.91681  ORF Transcript_32342/g.91681 Transcript_32342/m.91681 type:complete len:254 (+) Transcript_32342:82-843(+)